MLQFIRIPLHVFGETHRGDFSMFYRPFNSTSIYTYRLVLHLFIPAASTTRRRPPAVALRSKRNFLRRTSKLRNEIPQTAFPSERDIGALMKRIYYVYILKRRQRAGHAADGGGVRAAAIANSGDPRKKNT
ncbi:hypothetical protein EVAR_43138_1 [Eumeta japonica]|uniref:Uncharacterized protein n=1 Tax=Eumeta variegata TaxID=151549 RepID=A0A4C1XML7_EUMVA|nr:hypothetical protein EVAR_43138_1 [Eumeta japonica]